jgi:hypothetical protein
MTPNHAGTLMPFTWVEESISSLQPFDFAQGKLPRRPRCRSARFARSARRSAFGRWAAQESSLEVE